MQVADKKTTLRPKTATGHIPTPVPHTEHCPSGGGDDDTRSHNRADDGFGDIPSTILGRFRTSFGRLRTSSGEIWSILGPNWSNFCRARSQHGRHRPAFCRFRATLVDDAEFHDPPLVVDAAHQRCPRTKKQKLAGKENNYIEGFKSAAEKPTRREGKKRSFLATRGKRCPAELDRPAQSAGAAMQKTMASRCHALVSDRSAANRPAGTRKPQGTEPCRSAHCPHEFGSVANMAWRRMPCNIRHTRIQI